MNYMTSVQIQHLILLLFISNSKYYGTSNVVDKKHRGVKFTGSLPAVDNNDKFQPYYNTLILQGCNFTF